MCSCLRHQYSNVEYTFCKSKTGSQLFKISDVRDDERLQETNKYLMVVAKDGECARQYWKGLAGGYVNRAGVSPSLVILYLIMHERQLLFFLRLEGSFQCFLISY